LLIEPAVKVFIPRDFSGPVVESQICLASGY
jgi:hypothetical protein